jgi:hypothetical protein
MSAQHMVVAVFIIGASTYLLYRLRARFLKGNSSSRCGSCQGSKTNLLVKPLVSIGAPTIRKGKDDRSSS